MPAGCGAAQSYVSGSGSEEEEDEEKKLTINKRFHAGKSTYINVWAVIIEGN
jgi:hypothetical protein